jgi:hypothetical protein
MLLMTRRGQSSEFQRPEPGIAHITIGGLNQPLVPDDMLKNMPAVNPPRESLVYYDESIAPGVPLHGLSGRREISRGTYTRWVLPHMPASLTTYHH